MTIETLLDNKFCGRRLGIVYWGDFKPACGPDEVAIGIPEGAKKRFEKFGSSVKSKLGIIIEDFKRADFRKIGKNLYSKEDVYILPKEHAWTIYDKFDDIVPEDVH